MSESYICSERVRLTLGGNKDDGVGEEDMKAWVEYTADIFHIYSRKIIFI